MNSDAHDCCRCSGKMREGRHDFMAKVGNEIVFIKDVPALICDTCDEVEYTLEISREIDVIMKDFFAGRLQAVNGNLKFLNSGKVKFLTCKFLRSILRSCVDANPEAVPHVERFVQRRFKHQRDC